MGTWQALCDHVWIDHQNWFWVTGALTPQETHKRIADTKMFVLKALWTYGQKSVNPKKATYWLTIPTIQAGSKGSLSKDHTEETDVLHRAVSHGGDRKQKSGFNSISPLVFLLLLSSPSSLWSPLPLRSLITTLISQLHRKKGSVWLDLLNHGLNKEKSTRESKYNYIITNWLKKKTSNLGSTWRTNSC